MKLDSNCKRIIIEGYTSFDIQGVNLRETIESFVKTPDDDGKSLDIHGSVENLKDGRVEVIYTGKDAESFYTKLKQHLEEKKFKTKEFQQSEHYHAEAETFTNFTIKRADDISEMVLALRGAGYRFVESTRTLEKIYRHQVDTDNKLIENKLVTLHYELLSTIDEFASDNPSKDKFSTEVIKSHIASPVLSKGEFVNQLIVVFNKLQQFSSGPGVLDKWMDGLRKDLDKLREMIDEELDKRGIKI
jgi:acylphosphatase